MPIPACRLFPPPRRLRLRPSRPRPFTLACGRTSAVRNGFIYGLDESILACVDAATGDLKWKGGRYGYGQIMLASGHLVVLTEDGQLGLVRATPERHQEIAIFPVLDGKTWNHPAIAGGYLLVRNITEMAAFDLRVK